MDERKQVIEPRQPAQASGAWQALGIELPAEARQAIALAMQGMLRDISEDSYASQWMSECEYDIWQAIHESPTYWGGYAVPHDAAAALVMMSRLIDGWVDMAGYVPMAEWQARVESRQYRPVSQDVS